MLSRRLVITALMSAPMGYFRALSAQALPGWLTIDLNQWAGLRVDHKGKRITLTSDEIFAALRGLKEDL
jgi:hypothetical protein